MQNIRERIKELPDDFGVYIIKDSSENVIYVGKANSIRKRLNSHLRSRFAGKISKIDYILTKGELSALILEAKLIKQYHPKYNILMRDDKSYPYLRLSAEEDFPGLEIERRIKPGGSIYYGPFSGGAARELQKILSRLFGLRKCRTHPLKKRQQPCLNYYMKRCAGPCIGKITRDEYRKRVREVEDFMEQGVEKALKSMKVEMDKASKEEKFEKAAQIRDRMGGIEKAEGHRPEEEGGRKKGKGAKREGRMTDGLVELSNILSIKYPGRIEAFDISNLGPSGTVGAMAVFVNGLPHKKHYRKFKIRYKDLPNDTAAIYETVYRRYRRSLSKTLPLPDLIMIDGGKGQLSAAEDALKGSEAGNVPVIGLAKKEEEIFRPGVPVSIKMPGSSPSLLLLRRIRDEVHRFAIAFHRERRGKGFITNK